MYEYTHTHLYTVYVYIVIILYLFIYTYSIYLGSCCTPCRAPVLHISYKGIRAIVEYLKIFVK
jgi:hypothetical protein